MIRDLSSNVSNLCDVIDTRQVLERIEELENQYTDEATDELMLAGAWDADDWEERVTLLKLIDDVRGESDTSPEDGLTLIRENYFVDYIREFHSDCPRELYRYNEKTFRHELINWDELMSQPPFNNIDWERVANDERSYYSIVEYEGIDYYYQ